MPFIPRLESLGFSGIAYKCLLVLPQTDNFALASEDEDQE